MRGNEGPLLAWKVFFYFYLREGFFGFMLMEWLP